MRELDVLDVSAREHRRIHRHLTELIQQPEAVDLTSVVLFGAYLGYHEATDRLLLHPALSGTIDGRRLVAERRSEQALLSHLLASIIDDIRRAATPARRVETEFRDLERVLVGHTDREELEDFPHIRRQTTTGDRRQLARVRRQLERRVTAPIERAAREMGADLSGDITDPIHLAETAARDILERIEPAGLGHQPQPR